MVERRGEYFYDYLLWENRIRTHLYQMGFNMVPVVLLGEKKPYGVMLGEEGLKIYVEDYFRVNGEIRRRIREDIDYKIRLHYIVWSVFRQFEQALGKYVIRVENRTLNSADWESICKEHVNLLALLEMNFCLPTIWYNEKLSELADASQTNERYTFNDLSYSAVTPYTIVLRKARLKLCLKYYKNQLTDLDCQKYIDEIGFLDESLHNIGEITTKQITEMVEDICDSTLEKDVVLELQMIDSSRINARKNYFTKLLSVAQLMEKRHISKEEKYNFMLALSIIHLAATEEEYRRILQSKFFFFMYKLLNDLELPSNTSSIQDVLEMLKVKRG